MARGYDTLTEREKETLRLILHGHDAKSMARELELSVHTVNEYLRHARRKLAVTSSKEAARRLFEEEGAAPHFLGHKQLGEAAGARVAADGKAPVPGISPAHLIGGLIAMTIILATLALAMLPQQSTADPAVVSLVQQSAELETAAREWLELVDAGQWEASYTGTAAAFREANTLAQWTAVSQEVRPPLGKTVSRRFESVESPPTPQAYRIVKFATRFAARDEPYLETVTLVREDGGWKVVGIFIE